MNPDLSILFPDGEPKTRPEFKRARRLFILWVFNFRCFHCGKELNISTQTVDHLTPKSSGGSFLWWNLVPACGPCNFNKDSLMPTEREVERCKSAWMKLTDDRIISMLFQRCNALGPTSLKKSLKAYKSLTSEPCPPSFQPTSHF